MLDKFFFLYNSKSITLPNGDIYVTGGYKKSQNKSFPHNYKIDLKEKKAIKKASMNEGRSSHGICTYNKKIYVCGGKDSQSKLLKSFEVYYPETDKWVKLSDSFQHCVRCLLVGFTTRDRNEYIYKIGGYGSEGNILN